MEFTAERLCRYFHAGQVIQLVSAQGTTFAEVLACAPGRVTVRAEGPAPAAARVLVRAPVKSALFQASARVRGCAQRGDAVVLDTFTNVQCDERRTTDRLAEPVSTRVYHDDGPDGLHRIAAVNLGASGLLLGWPEAPAVVLGERVRLEITLDAGVVSAVGRVIRVDGCHSAVQFLEISEADQNRIAAYVFRREVAA